MTSTWVPNAKHRNIFFSVFDNAKQNGYFVYTEKKICFFFCINKGERRKTFTKWSGWIWHVLCAKNFIRSNLNRGCLTYFWYERVNGVTKLILFLQLFTVPKYTRIPSSLLCMCVWQRWQKEIRRNVGWASIWIIFIWFVSKKKV